LTATKTTDRVAWRIPGRGHLRGRLHVNASSSSSALPAAEVGLLLPFEGARAALDEIAPDGSPLVARPRCGRRSTRCQQSAVPGWEPRCAFTARRGRSSRSRRGLVRGVGKAFTASGRAVNASQGEKLTGGIVYLDDYSACEISQKKGGVISS
jgi:hypothetical protein